LFRSFVCLTVGKQRLYNELGCITNILSIDHFFRLLKLLVFDGLRYCVTLREFFWWQCHKVSPFLVPPLNYLHTCLWCMLIVKRWTRCCETLARVGAL